MIDLRSPGINYQDFTTGIIPNIKKTKSEENKLVKIIIEVNGQNELQEVLEALGVNNNQIKIVYKGSE